MTCNMGKTDRTIRIVVGLAIIAAGVALKSWWGLVGAVPLVTAVVGWCPMYVPFKISTRSTRKTT